MTKTPLPQPWRPHRLGAAVAATVLALASGAAAAAQAAPAMPVQTSTPDLVYPEAAERAGHEALCTAVYDVDGKGKVRNACAKCDADGHTAGFEAALLQTVEAITYEPTTGRDAIAFERIVMPVPFFLDDTPPDLTAPLPSACAGRGE
jgi:hypothetical protein